MKKLANKMNLSQIISLLMCIFFIWENFRMRQ
ncbi:Ycf66 family protein [Psychroserpens sp. Hel_I_66]